MKGYKLSLSVIAASVALAMTTTPALAEAPSKAEKKVEKKADAKSDKKSDKKGKKDKKDKEKTIAELIKDTKEYKGLFTLYQSKKDGSLMMKVRKDQLGKEFIHFVHSLDGVADLGYFRGGYRGANIYSIDRHFNKVEIKSENTSFYFDEKSPLAKAKNANINNPVLASLKIEAEDKKTGDILIKADKLFLTESLRQIKPSSNPKDKPGKRWKLGKLSKSKTKYDGIFNYENNTDVEVNYAYDSSAPVRPSRNTVSKGDFAFTDDRSINIKIRHSFIEVPDNNFKPRFDDPRIGYFGQIQHDMTVADDATPYRDMINRWNLEKKDPSAAVSEPKEPIVWWIENTTPHEFRDIIRDATLSWNSSFEKAGFKNAVVVKVQPDDAKWDAGDINYNVLRWTSSPRPVFSGYGPSFANPRTGQILGSDIMLEFSGFTRRLDVQKIFDAGTFISDGASVETSVDVSDMHMFDHSPIYESAQFGNYAMLAMNANDAKRDEFVKEFLYYLVLHEVGHTLGLNHNMRATQLLDSKQVHDKELTMKHGLQGSVMDYPSINFAPNGVEQGQYYTSVPGAYDDWAIEFGYSSALNDEAAEKKRLAKLLSRASEPALAFGNDADDMRSPGKAIDPHINIYDMSNEAILYATQRMDRVKTLSKELKENFAKKHESYQELTNAYMVLMGEYSRQNQVISRYVGGVHIDRSFEGEGSGKTPFTPVDKAEQKAAMAALAKYSFAPDAYTIDEDLVKHLQNQRRGFFHFGKNEDPKLHDMVIRSQKAVLNHIMHPRVLKRIQDSTLYGNEYSLAEMMTDLTKAVFKADAKSNVNSFRQNLQREYVERLAKMIKGKAKDGGAHASQSIARYNLKNIKSMLKTKRNNSATVAHKEQLVYMIEKALDPRA